jgi:hypothetical protein
MKDEESVFTLQPSAFILLGGVWNFNFRQLI